MGTLSHVLHTGPRPISVHEFGEALRAVCPPRFPTPRVNMHRLVGMAVSGGVDSMALAYLCSRLRSYDINFNIADNPVSSFRAFVINHRLRDGSAAEAGAVAAAVRKMGMYGDVGTIFWARALGRDIDPKDLPNFESVARRLRYQKLARMCMRFNIDSLLFAHHEDDQYETVLMRLMQGHGVRGLRGMRAASDIPECEGIHGAHGSGYVDDQRLKTPYYDSRVTKRQYKAMKHDLRSRIDYHMNEEELRTAIPDGLDGHDFDALYQAGRAAAVDLANVDVEDGGIMIYRPLLGFSKDRLVATCEANNVPWWEDETNEDPTLTTRNAVRHMVKNYTLPVALQKPSVLALSRRCEQKAKALEAEADRLLAQTIIHDVESHVGTASVQFPGYGLSRFPRDRSSAMRRQARIQRQREVAGLLIKRIIALVSPETQSVPLANLQNVISRLFPALSNEEQRTSEPPKAFGIAGVHFVPILPSSRAGNEALMWYLGRTPYPSHQPLPRYRTPYWCAPRNGWRGSGPREFESRWCTWSRWCLWDGRFWVRMRHRLPYRVILQPFLREHAKSFREALQPADRDRLAALLKRYAPGKARYTLPALYTEEELDLGNVVPRPYYPLPPSVTCQIKGAHAFETERGEAAKRGGRNSRSVKWNTDPTSDHPRVLDTDKMELVALPSLDIHIPRINEWLEWEVRYRRVARDTLATAGSFTRGSFREPRLRSARPGPGPQRIPKPVSRRCVRVAPRVNVAKQRRERKEPRRTHGSERERNEASV